MTEPSKPLVAGAPMGAGQPPALQQVPGQSPSPSSGESPEASVPAQVQTGTPQVPAAPSATGGMQMFSAGQVSAPTAAPPQLSPPGPAQMGGGAAPVALGSPSMQPQAGGANLQAFSQDARPALNAPGQLPAAQPTPPPPEAKTLKVEDALTYLDEVKRQFADKPQIYNHFLEIMKSFKAETIDTPGVIQKVSELFRGHNNLILGFNTFLPAGYRIEQSDLIDDKPPQQQQQHGVAPGIPGVHPMMATAPNLSLPAQLLGAQNVLQQSMMLGPQHAMLRDNPALFMNPAYFGEAAHPYMLMMNQEQLQQQQLQQLQQQQAMQGATAGGQPVEFDHAINYVTKIKRRFQNDSETYKSFLEILHTYQKEQKSIKEVLDQVSELFRDHPDLLKEFTYFLPDGVREKAKQEISKIQNRRRKEEQRKADKKGLDQSKMLKKEGKDKITGGAMSLTQNMMMGASQRTHSPMTGRRLDEGDMDEVQMGGESGAGRGADRILIQLGKIPRMEKRFFSRIKGALGTRERWSSFLKCLELFSLEIVSRQELMALCSDLFMAQPELLDEFDRLLASRGVTDDATEDAWFSVPITDIDFSQTRKCTPSYRLLPTNYPRPRCSERTPLCRAVLNDTWINLPAGAEDYGFKSMKRNQYEDALFRCEDERFELDLIIEANLSAIRALEPLAREIAEREQQQQGKGGDVQMNDGATENEEQRRFRLDRRTLSVIHLKAIARVYSERSNEVFELLRKSPASAIPVILERLHAKDAEWRKLRLKMNETWREVMEKNYVRSLDHRSWQFRTNEKRTLAAKSILAEIRDAPDRKMTLEFGDAFVHRHASALLYVALERTLSKPELDRCMAGLEKVLAKLVGVKGYGGKASVSTKVGTKVLTRYGMGSIVSANNTVCEVKLLGGTSVLKINRDDLLEAAPFSPKETQTTGELAPAYVGQHGYLFLRFYSLLCERIVRAETVCLNLEREQRTQVKHVLERNGEEDEVSQGGASAEEQPQSLFGRTVEHIKQLLRGAVDSNTFEDELYNMIGAHCYFLCTIDRLVRHLATHLQSLVLDERAVKVAELAAKYSERKLASNAAELYRAISEALVASSACPAAKVRFVAGTNPLCPPQKPRTTDEKKEEDASVSLDILWETRPSVVIEFMDSIPQAVVFGAAGNNARSLSPVGFEADGSPIPTEMGELEVALPIKYEFKVKSVPSPAVPVVPAAETEPGKNKKAASTLGEDAPFLIGVYSVEKLPGSDDVFRRILAYKNEQQQQPGSEKDWWRSSAGSGARGGDMDRTISPVPDDESSSSDEGAAPAAVVAPPSSKRARTSVAPAAVEDAE